MGVIRLKIEVYFGTSHVVYWRECAVFVLVSEGGNELMVVGGGDPIWEVLLARGQTTFDYKDDKRSKFWLDIENLCTLIKVLFHI